jgi:hypothetical protein
MRTALLAWALLIGRSSAAGMVPVPEVTVGDLVARSDVVAVGWIGSVGDAGPASITTGTHNPATRYPPSYPPWTIPIWTSNTPASPVSPRLRGRPTGCRVFRCLSRIPTGTSHSGKSAWRNDNGRGRSEQRARTQENGAGRRSGALSVSRRLLVGRRRTAPARDPRARTVARASAGHDACR